MKNVLSFFIALLLLSCQDLDQRKYPFDLAASDKFLSFPIDENTRLPNSIFTFEMEGNMYLSFLNGWKELLIYDVVQEQLIKKVSFEHMAARNNIHDIYSFNIVDFNTIYLSTTNENLLCLVDTAAQMKSKIVFSSSFDENKLIPTLYSPIVVGNDSIYIHQGINLQYGYNSMGKSPLGLMIDTLSKNVKFTPLKYLDMYSNEELVYCTHGNRNWCCYDGNRILYSYDTKDSIITLDTQFKNQESYECKSKFIEKVSSKSNSNWDLNQILKETCETSSYGNIIYDKYRNIYYRIAYPDVEFEKDDDFLAVFRGGRAQFSIIVLDKNLNIIGETLFPSNTYNPNILFVDKDGLYISTSHYKREDYSDDWLRFQCLELVNK